MGLRVDQPHLEDGSAYRQNRPTKLDKIKNFRDQVPADCVDDEPASAISKPTFGVVLGRGIGD